MSGKVKNFNLIKFTKRVDFGTDWYVQFICLNDWALLQASVSWNDYASWPYLQIKSGNGSLLNIMFWAYRFGLDFGFVERTWNWEYFEEEDTSETDTQYH